MDNDEIADQIVQNLAFEVEASHDNTVRSTNKANITPINVKVKVRKKDEDGVFQRGIISVPRFGHYSKGPEKIRMISSDQTIISFNLVMETEPERVVHRKPRKKFFGFIKSGACLGAEYDDIDTPYLPSSSNKADLNESTSNSKSDGVLKQNFTLSKNTYENITTHSKKSHGFLKDCKPGGCLDPPFGEDTYKYKLATISKSITSQSIADEQGTIELDKHTYTFKQNIQYADKISDERRKSSNGASATKELNKINNQTTPILLPNQIESLTKSFSSSIITYPPTVSSSELGNKKESFDKNKKHRPSDEKSRKSFNEFNEIYFTPPKRVSKERDSVNRHEIPRYKSIDDKKSNESIVLKEEMSLTSESGSEEVYEETHVRPVVPELTPKVEPRSLNIASVSPKSFNESTKENLFYHDSKLNGHSMKQTDIDKHTNKTDIKNNSTELDITQLTLTKTTDILNEGSVKDRNIQDFDTDNVNLIQPQLSKDSLKSIHSPLKDYGPNDEFSESKVSQAVNNIPLYKADMYEETQRDSPNKIYIKEEGKVPPKNIRPAETNDVNDLLYSNTHAFQKWEITGNETTKENTDSIISNISEILQKPKEHTQSLNSENYMPLNIDDTYSETREKIITDKTTKLNKTEEKSLDHVLYSADIGPNNLLDESRSDIGANTNTDLNIGTTTSAPKTDEIYNKDIRESYEHVKTFESSKTNISLEHDFKNIKNGSIISSDSNKDMDSTSKTKGNFNKDTSEAALYDDVKIIESLNTNDIGQKQDLRNSQQESITGSELKKDIASATSDNQVNIDTAMISKQRADENENYASEKKEFLDGTDIKPIVDQKAIDDQLIELRPSTDDVLNLKDIKDIVNVEAALEKSYYDPYFNDDLNEQKTEENKVPVTKALTLPDNQLPEVTSLHADITYPIYKSIDSSIVSQDYNLFKIADNITSDVNDRDILKKLETEGGFEPLEQDILDSITNLTKDVRLDLDSKIKHPYLTSDIKARDSYNYSQDIRNDTIYATRSSIELMTDSQVYKNKIDNTNVSLQLKPTTAEFISLDLAFQSFLNDDMQRVVKTIDSSSEPDRYPNDIITVIKSDIKIPADEIRIPISAEQDIIFQIKSNSELRNHKQQGEARKEDSSCFDSGSTSKETSGKSQYSALSYTNRDARISAIELFHGKLNKIYERELVPLKNTIQTLKEEIDTLAAQQLAIKDKLFGEKKTKPKRLIQINDRCVCIRQ